MTVPHDRRTLPEANMGKLQQIIRERPNFHRGETEIDRPLDPSESLLSPEHAARLASGELACYGIEPEVLSFIADNVGEGSRTLETGAGCSTLVFAIRGCDHIAVTPSRSEITLITHYAAQHEICCDMVHFVQESSDRYLARVEIEGLDLVLLDGKHAFPWPIVDWFFAADRLRKGGVMIIDDVQIRSVSILADFMRLEPGWKVMREFSGKTIAFLKTRDSIRNVAWHMQPFSFAQASPAPAGVGVRRACRLLVDALKNSARWRIRHREHGDDLAK